MPETIDDYRCKLINEILFASTQMEVNEIVSNAYKRLLDKKANSFVIVRFVVKTLFNLEKFHPSEHSNTQWVNISYAKQLIYQKAKGLSIN